MKAKIFIVDNVIVSVMGDDEAINAGLNVEIVQYDRDTGDRDQLMTEFNERELFEIPHMMKHCED